ncbi:Fe2OG dioxygenase domain-containing protein [Favolaschia claudopus]|uniref:Fe2OG dioxygenase domain-containing protein n=1 Tax=Favolaschia claudopus TaxID=2862362 RepID=A0AAW0D667_9AGAR
MADSKTENASSIEARLQILRQAILTGVPYIGGVHPVKAEDLVLYYDVEGGNPPNRRIDLGKASEDDLKDLAAACQKATFGVNQADVLDETYRKAGKMDLDKFATRLDVLSSGILSAIKQDILQGQAAGSDKVLVPELYKLNVYGPGAFFKAHKDTPRGDTMIGSLVIVFPTAHEGGGLTLEHDGKAWTFDSAKELSASKSTPAIAYVAFYSDVTHAVEPVKSGHRVTLTYNLFLKDEGKSPDVGARLVPSHNPDRIFEETLRALLADAEFLPTGGLLAFGLSHQYPIPGEAEEPHWDHENGTWIQRPSRLPPLLKLLKGSDARIRTVAERVGLETNVKILYNSGEPYDDEVGHDVLTDDVVNLNHLYGEDHRMMEKIERTGIIVERDAEREERFAEERREYMGGFDDDYKIAEKDVKKTAVHWVTKVTELNKTSSHFLAYGNEASIGHIYGNAALFVQIPAFDNGVRGTAA